MKMNRTTIAQRLKTFAAALTVALVAVVGFAAAPQDAWADIVNGYEGTPYNDITMGPGFKWVEPTDTEPGYYLVYDPLNDSSLTDPGVTGQYHEECAGWYYFVEASRLHDFEGYLVKLNSSINFKNYNFDRDPSAGRTQLTVGSDDMPFAGTFDGQNWTISNLSNEREGLAIVTDCGFFGVTDGATIKNLKLADCYVGGSYRSAVLVGLAQNTLIENVILNNCTSSVIPGNNVINLITNAGMSSGILAGETVGSTLYNCEVKDGSAVCNATQGIAALGGQPLYLGAMVGFSTDSVIEYCRVSATTGEDGKIVDGGRTDVSMHYDTAVGAVAASEVYTGGLVGGASSSGDEGSVPSQIIDCFSTADLNSYAACYISVGAGTAGYVGGIVGRTGQSVGGSSTVYLSRCSFAGDMSSRQVNSILVLPVIIEDNKFLAAFVGRDSTHASVEQCYYNENMAAASIDGDTGKIVSMQDGTLASDTVTYGSTFGPKASEYTNVDFWEGCTFDFGGAVERTAPHGYPAGTEPTTTSTLLNNEGHANKWVMNFDIGIPVHGMSITATFDFPGAGTVEIGTTEHDNNQADDGNDPAWKTTDPYEFAVQGFLPVDTGTQEVTIKYAEGPNPAQGNDDGANTGWRVYGWYRQQSVGYTSIPANHDLFTADGEQPYLGEGPIIGNEEKLVSEKNGDVQSITRKNDAAGESDPEYVDGDLYVAYLQANVLLHDVNGGIVSRETGETQGGSTEADWYDYNAQLMTPATVVNAPTAEGTQLIGWTSVPSSGSMNYSAITSTDLDTLRGQGVFYPVDESGRATITVNEPMNLWPVYSNYITNITVIYEGDERDNTVARNIREGFGEANVTVDEQAGDVILTVKPYKDSPLTKGTVRFLGWYEEVDPTDGENWVKVDAGTQPQADNDGNVLNGDGEYINKPTADTECFSFNLTQSEVDLTQPHSYKARFEYEVTYYLDSGSDEVVAKLWHQYAQTFKAPQDLDFDYGGSPSPFADWYFGSECYTGASSAVGDAVESPGHNEVSSTFAVHYPMPVHAHWEKDAPSQDHDRDIITTTDFPGSAAVSAEHEHNTWLAGDATFSADVSKGYHLKFWSGDYSNGRWKANNYSATGESEDKVWTVHAVTGWSDTAWIEAHMTADVTFKLPDKDDMVVERRYRQKIFTHSRTYPWETIVYYHYDDDVEAGRIKVGVTDSATGEMDPQNYEVGAEARAAAPKGYAFLGWIDHSALTNGEMTQGEWDYIFEDGVAAAKGSDITTVQYVSRVVPYLVDEDAAVCTRPTELYPVYVPISIESSTNVREAGVPNGYNLPSIPKVECTSDSETVYNQTYNLNYAPTDPKFPIDGEIVVGGGTKAEIATLSYNRRGEAELRVTADLGGPIKNGSDKNYELVSLTVSVDGVEQELSLDQGAEDDGAGTIAFEIPITLGHSYIFRANYKPIPVSVTYHHNTDDTEIFDVLEVGDKLPVPTRKPSYENQGFFVGWAEKPAGNTSNDPIDYTDDIVFANPGVDTVNHSMDLWPVYCRGTVSVISNQDEAFKNASMDLDTIRYVEKRASDADGLWIVAQDVPGYEFKGWQKQGGDGSFITQAREFRLTGADRFEEGAVYVAIYEKTTVINYHGTDGSIIFSQSVATDEGRYTNDGFIYEVEIEEGEKQDAVYDGEAFGAILSELATKDGAYYEKFINWQLKTDAGGYEEWNSADPNNFTHKGIGELAGADGTVDLYPITVALSAQKPGDSGPVDYTKSVNWAVEAPANDDGTTDTDALAVNVLLTEDYTHPWLMVSVDKLVYTAEADGSDDKAPLPQGMEDVPVRLYAKDSSGGIALDTDETRSREDEVSGVNLDRGDAIFTFNGMLEITKTSSDEEAAGQTFTFKVTSADKTMSQTVLITLPDEPTNGAYTASARVQLPYGEYTVEEDTGWAWRYTVSLQKCLSQGSAWEDMANGTSVTVKYAGYSGEGADVQLTPVRVKATNSLENDSWFSDDARIKNEFKASEGTGE